MSSTGGKSSHPLGHANALKPAAPASAIVRERAYRARHEAGPDRDVDAAARASGVGLGAHGRQRDRRRVGVDRHVDDGGHAARGRGRAPAVEALPPLAAGIVEVHVRVDRAGHDEQAVRVDVVRSEMCRTPVVRARRSASRRPRRRAVRCDRAARHARPESRTRSRQRRHPLDGRDAHLGFERGPHIGSWPGSSR